MKLKLVLSVAAASIAAAPMVAFAKVDGPDRSHHAARHASHRPMMPSRAGKASVGATPVQMHPTSAAAPKAK